MDPRIIERSQLINSATLDELKKTINSYNARFDEIIKYQEEGKTKFLPKELEKEMEALQTKLRADFLGKATSYVKKYLDSKESDQRSLAKKKYPLTSSEPSQINSSERSAGEMQIQAAINLVNGGKFDKPHLEKIKSEIVTGIRIKRVDFVSTVFNELDYSDNMKLVADDKLNELRSVYEKEFGIAEEVRRYEISCAGYAISKMFFETVKLGKDYAFLPIPIPEVNVFDYQNNKSQAAFLGFSGSPGFWSNEENFGIRTTLL